MTRIHFNMTNIEIQEQIQLKASDLLKGPPELLEAMGERASDAAKSVAYFRDLGDKDRVRYEMREFLRWLEKMQSEYNI